MSTTVRLRATVPEDRRVTIALPDGVPAGEAELLVTVGPPPAPPVEVAAPPRAAGGAHPGRPAHPKLAAEHDEFVRRLPDLLRAHPGRYVALHDGEVVADGPDEVTALTRAQAARPGALVLVRRVTDRPQPVERLPRLPPGG